MALNLEDILNNAGEPKEETTQPEDTMGDDTIIDEEGAYPEDFDENGDFGDEEGFGDEDEPEEWDESEDFDEPENFDEPEEFDGESFDDSEDGETPQPENKQEAPAEPEITLDTLDKFGGQEDKVLVWIQDNYEKLWESFNKDKSWALLYAESKKLTSPSETSAEELDKFSVYLTHNTKSYEGSACYEDDEYYDLGVQMADEANNYKVAKVSSVLLSIKANLHVCEENGITETVQTVICKKCGHPVRLKEFEGKSELRHNCKALIDTKGNVIKEESKVKCPVCGKKYVPQKDKDAAKQSMCPDCLRKEITKDDFINNIKNFLKEADKASAEGTDTDKCLYAVFGYGTEPLNSTFQAMINTTVDNLLKVYGFYVDTLEPLHGVLSALNTGACLVKYNKKTGDMGLVSSRDTGLQFDDLWQVIKLGLGKENGKYVNKAMLDSEPNKIIGTYSNPSLVEFISNYSFDKHAKNPFMASGYHAAHIMGYYHDGTRYIKIQRAKGKFPDTFKDHIRDTVTEAFWECLYNSKDSVVVKGTSGAEYTVEYVINYLLGEGINGSKTFTKSPKYDNTHAKNFEARLRVFMGHFLSDMFERLTNMIVFRTCDTGSIGIEMWFHADESIEKHGKATNTVDNSMPATIGAAFNALLTKQQQSLEARALSDRLFGSGARNQQIVSNQWTEQGRILGSTMLKMYSFIVVMDSDSYLAYPLFAYKPMTKLAELGQLSPENTLVGQKLDGTFMYIRDLMKLNGISLFATSRAGKGVMTLALCGTFFATGSPIMYFDAKPEMTGTLLTISDLYTERLKKLGINKKVRFAAYEFKTPLEADLGNKFYMDLKKAAPKAYEIMKEDQRFWIANMRDETKKKVWKDRYGIDMPTFQKESDRDALTVMLYYRAIQLGQCLIKIGRNAGIKIKRPIVIMDELNRGFGLTPSSGKVASTPMLKWVSNANETLKGITTELKSDAKTATKEEKAEINQKLRKVDKQTLAFIKWLSRIFVGMSGKGGLDNASLDLGGTDFYKDMLSVAAAKDGSTPLYLGIGQSRSAFELSADCPIKYLLNSCDVKIQGNWNDDDMNSTVQVVQNTLEAKAKYIHPFSGGNISGFFANETSSGVDVYRSYLVLNENSDTYIEGSENTTRGRVQKSLSGKGKSARSIDIALNKLLLKNFDANQMGADEKLYPLSEVIANHKTFEREPGVGFPGYIDMLAGLNSDIDTKGAEALTAEEKQKMKDYILKLGEGYDLITQVFLSTGVAKHFGYKCLEEYLYDMHPDSFLPNSLLCLTDQQAFEEGLAELNGTVGEGVEEGEGMNDADIDIDSELDTDSAVKERLDRAIDKISRLISTMESCYEKYKSLKSREKQDSVLKVIKGLAQNVLSELNGGPYDVKIEPDKPEFTSAFPDECATFDEKFEAFDKLNDAYIALRIK